MGRFHVRFPLAVLSLLAVGGCDDSTTLVLESNPAVTLFIDSTRCPQVRKCSTCQLLYEAYDKNGQPARTPTVLWISQNPAVATVTQAGRVEAWETGIATVVAQVQETGVTDQVSIPVTPPPVPLTCTPPGADLGPAYTGTLSL